jgi:RHS repeat-associated protein
VLTRQSYYPYGGVRQLGDLPTDITFTGQRSDTGIGLMDFKARAYSPTLGRFVSADTVVPGAGNPQAFNRYSYALSNPLKYNDPSGYISCNANTAQGDCIDTDFLLQEFSRFGVKLVGSWSHIDMWAVYEAILSTAQKLGGVLGLSAVSAFQAVFGTHSKSMVIEYGNCSECNGEGGYTYGSHLIRFADLSDRDGLDGALRRRNNVVHEFGHAFKARLKNMAGLDVYDLLAKAQSAGLVPDRLDPPPKLPDGTTQTGPSYGFASPQNIFTWQQNPSASPNEEYADMFLGWTFNTWDIQQGALTNDGQRRANWMNLQMPSLVVNTLKIIGERQHE